MNNFTTAKTMTSREIAELTGKRHDNVMADISRVFAELNINSPEFLGEYKDSSGKVNKLYNLPKRECLILVSGYSTVLRARIIDRWQELESNQQKIPTLPEALRGWVKLELVSEKKASAEVIGMYKSDIDCLERTIDNLTTYAWGKKRGKE